MGVREGQTEQEHTAPELDVSADIPVSATRDSQRLMELEARVSELTQALSALDGRVLGLEEAKVPVSLSAAANAGAAASEIEPGDEPSELSQPAQPELRAGELLPQIASIGGRTLLILGGGYLLRDLTERGTLGHALGTVAGLAYATIWLVLSDQRARKGPSAAAAFYGVVYALIALPLMGEVTARFELLSPWQSAFGFCASAAAGMFVAWRRRMALIAWAVLGLLVFTVAGTVAETHTPVPFLLLLVATGVGFDLGAELREWWALRIASAAVVDLAVLAFTAVILTQGAYSSTTLVVQLTLFAAYMLSFSVRARVQQRFLTAYERLQSIAVLLVGYLGAVLVTHVAPEGPRLALGAASLVAGAGAYAIAYFLFVVPAKNRVEAWFTTTYALSGVLVGSWLLLAEPGFAWTPIGVLLALLGMRDKHAALPLHAAICAFVAALGSRLLPETWDAFWASPHTSWTTLDAPSFAALALALLAYLLPLESSQARGLWPGRAGKVLALAVLVAGLGGVLLALLVDPVGGGLGEGADPGRIAALRTAVLAASALSLAAASRIERFREAGLLVYPVLGIGAVKLVVQDFPTGRAITLFIGFALLGMASVIAPRLRFRGPKTPA